jgi:dihydroorotase-like cyclic amidohydrolase
VKERINVQSFLIKNVRLLDPALGLDKTGDLRVRDGKIAEIGKNLSKASDEETTDGSGRV